MSSLRPLLDRFVIDPILPEEKINGIIIPQMAQKPPNTGKIIAMSKKMEKEEDIKVGDFVIFSNYASTHIVFDDKDMFLVRLHDIMAII